MDQRGFGPGSQPARYASWPAPGLRPDSGRALAVRVTPAPSRARPGGRDPQPPPGPTGDPEWAGLASPRQAASSSTAHPILALAEFAVTDADSDRRGRPARLFSVQEIEVELSGAAIRLRDPDSRRSSTAQRLEHLSSFFFEHVQRYGGLTLGSTLSRYIADETPRLLVVRSTETDRPEVLTALARLSYVQAAIAADSGRPGLAQGYYRHALRLARRVAPGPTTPSLCAPWPPWRTALAREPSVGNSRATPSRSQGRTRRLRSGASSTPVMPSLWPGPATAPLRCVLSPPPCGYTRRTSKRRVPSRPTRKRRSSTSALSCSRLWEQVLTTSRPSWTP